MLTEEISRFIESIEHAFVASADESGRPHLAVGRDLHVVNGSHLVFEAWFCHKTMENVAKNPYVSVTVAASAAGNGYQFSGVVEKTAETAILDGYAPLEEPGMPQVQYRLVVKVDEIMEFSSGVHTDQPLGPVKK